MTEFYSAHNVYNNSIGRIIRFMTSNGWYKFNELTAEIKKQEEAKGLKINYRRDSYLDMWSNYWLEDHMMSLREIRGK